MEKRIKDFEDYAITNDGKVISYKNNKRKELSQWKDSKGRYLYVTLSMDNQKTNRSVHSLVAETFVIRYESNTIVDHIDDDIYNNHYTNLQWITQRENIVKGYKTMSQVRNKRTTALYYKNELVNTFESVKAAIRYAAEHYKVSASSLEKYKYSGDCEIRKV